VDKRLAQVLPWGTAYIFFCDDYYYSEKKITNFGFTHIIKQLMTGFQLMPRFINPRDLIITSADGLGDNQMSGVDKSWY